MTERLEEFVRRVVDAASALGIAAEAREALISANFRGGSGEAVLKGSHLPDQVAAKTIGRFPILFGLLPVSPEAVLVREGVRRYRNQAVVSRSHLPLGQAMDLQIWFVGPDGSEGDPAWLTLALAIERDDKVARKLVWLPPEGEAERDVSFLRFAARTFLARPWKSVPPQSGAQLDRLSELFSLAEGLGIEPTVLGQWFELADSDLADGAELVDALVAAWPGRAT